MDKLKDVGAERAILSGLFQYGTECYYDIESIISTKTFVSPANQVVYACLKKVMETQNEIDIPSVLSAAKDLDLYEAINTKPQLEYLSSLDRFPVKLENVEQFAARIRKLEIARDVSRVADRIKKEVATVTGDESVDEIISMAELPIFDLATSLDGDTSNKPIVLSDGMDEYLLYLMENPCEMIGLDSGMPRFNKSIGGGFRRKSLDLIAARPKAGKSMLAMNIGLHVSGKLNIPILIVDTEMAREDQMNRTLANLSGVPTEDIGTGMFGSNPQSKESVFQCAKDFKEIPYHYINVSGMLFEESLSVIKRWIMQNVPIGEDGKRKDCLIIYDYLKLVSSKDLNRNVQEYQALGFNITNLYNLTVKYDIPCLSFIQTSREGINKEDSSVVSGSDRQVWLCTSLTLLKKKSSLEMAEDGPEHGSRKMVPVLSRHGEEENDENYINLNFDGSRARFKEGLSRNEAKTKSLQVDQGYVKPEDGEEGVFDQTSD